MQVIARRTLIEFWTTHSRAKVSLQEWYAAVSAGQWAGPADVRARFGSVDFIGDNRVIFDIGGNRYRVVARISYKYRAVQVKFIGTHAEYDKIDPETAG